MRATQLKYFFFKELTTKYGIPQGQYLFDWCNYVFDRLPFCAVINQSIFCAHGGIPCTMTDLEQINKTTPKCVHDPDQEAIVEWEILWS